MLNKFLSYLHLTASFHFFNLNEGFLDIIDRFIKLAIDTHYLSQNRGESK